MVASNVRARRRRFGPRRRTARVAAPPRPGAPRQAATSSSWSLGAAPSRRSAEGRGPAASGRREGRQRGGSGRGSWTSAPGSRRLDATTRGACRLLPAASRRRKFERAVCRRLPRRPSRVGAASGERRRRRLRKRSTVNENPADCESSPPGLPRRRAIPRRLRASLASGGGGGSLGRPTRCAKRWPRWLARALVRRTATRWRAPASAGSLSPLSRLQPRARRARRRARARAVSRDATRDASRRAPRGVRDGTRQHACPGSPNTCADGRSLLVVGPSSPTRDADVDEHDRSVASSTTLANERLRRRARKPWRAAAVARSRVAGVPRAARSALATARDEPNVLPNALAPARARRAAARAATATQQAARRRRRARVRAATRRGLLGAHESRRPRTPPSASRVFARGGDDVARHGG